jgi:N-alpha-acetyltransferase 35, NatC auxiliary subunit
MNHAIKDLEARSVAGDDTRVSDALLERLKLRIALLKTFMCCLDSMDPSSEISAIIASMETVDASSDFAEPLPEAFSIKIQRRLASSVPPRPMIVVERTESTTFFQQLLANIGSAFHMFKISYSFDLFTAYWIFMNQKPEPSVYVRALLQSFLNIDDHVLGKQTTKDFAVADLKSMVLPASLLLDPANEVVENPIDTRFRIASQMTQFMHKVSPSFVNQYRSLCQNRCRLRRLLCHAAIELDNIQADAEDLDGFFQTLVNEKPLPYPAGEAPTYAYPLSSWIYHYKLIQLQLVVHMGFELSVYATHEYSGMYWYLSHLTSLHLSHLERISYFVSSQSQSQAGQSRELQIKEIQHALSLLYRHFSRLKATDTLASALHRLYVVLQRQGHCTKMSPAYATDELRFDLRMRPFQSLSIPEPLTFQEMESLTELGSLVDKEILDQAARLALTSRKAWEEVLKHDWNFNPLQSVASAVGSGQKHGSVIEREWKTEVRNSMKACIGTSIAITSVSKALKGSGKDKQSLKDLRVSIPGPEDADRFHRWWAVPKISR